MNIDHIKLHEQTTRVICPCCKRPRKHYCYSCLQLCGLEESDIPKVELPFECHIIKHIEESDSKSTAVHAYLLSKQVTLFDYPGVVPPYTSSGDVVVCFPYKHAVTIPQYCADIRQKKRRLPKIVLVLDGTWSNVQQIAPYYDKYPAVKLTDHETAFWRKHLRHTPNSYLSTIEAVYFFYKEFCESVPLVRDIKSLDGLLFFFSFQQQLFRDKNKIVATNEHCLFDPEVVNYLRATFPEEQLSSVLKLVQLPPKWTTIRVNTSAHNREDVISELQQLLDHRFEVCRHRALHDVILVSSKQNKDLAFSSTNAVVIDQKCGKAVLRGADIFAPGIKGLPHLKTNSTVSVHVDISHKCKRGEKNFSGATVHIANGRLLMNRKDIFKNMIKSGVAVLITERLVDIPCLNNTLEDRLFLQNLPSIVTSHVLDPQPGDRVLDMCAAPGGKTTHIAQLMGDAGHIVALEKVQQKIERMKSNIVKQNLKSISLFKWDSTQAFCDGSTSDSSPPFGREVFDRILVDPPCSALGQRPQLINLSKLSQISSYPSYQWCFVADAVKMLKCGGTLVYSTCSFPIQENEMIVTRVLETFPEMRLVRAEPVVGQPGSPVEPLSQEQIKMLQRFTPQTTTNGIDSDVNCDTIGFFIAKFMKVGRADMTILHDPRRVGKEMIGS